MLPHSTKKNLVSQEAYKSLQEQIKTQEEEVEDISAEQQEQPRRKRREQAVKLSETLLDTTNRSKGSKTDKQSDSQESKAVRGRRKPPGPMKSAPVQEQNQRRVKTEVESASQQAAPPRSRKKNAAAADDAADNDQNTGLRRSKRLASRR